MKPLTSIILTICTVVGCFSNLSAADNFRAILFYKMNLLESAEEMFQSNRNNEANSAETDYFLGCIALKKGQQDSATAYFAEGLKSNSDFIYNKIGEAHIQLLKDPQRGKAMLDQLLSGRNKREIGLNLAVATILLEQNHPGYSVLIEELLRENEKNPSIYILRGDALLKRELYGEACTQYEHAIYYDATAEEAYLKYAEVYRVTNPTLALETLAKLLTINPNSELAYREMAEVNFSSGNFKEAALHYDKYLSFTSIPSRQDLVHYATVLFYNKEYTKALQHVDNLLAKDPKDQVTNRLKMYINVEMALSPEIVTQAESYMRSFESKEYIALDYIYYGRLLIKAKRMGDATYQFAKAIQADETKVEAYRELADLYETMDNHEQAITTYQAFKQRHPTELKATDYLAFGKNYYFAGSSLPAADSLKRPSYFQQADLQFIEVTERSPENPLGYIWRARALASLDPETTKALAKPYYEKVIALLEIEGKDKKKLTEAYNYLGFYYYVINDYPMSKTFWNKTLGVDPTNETAQKAVEAINAQK